MQIGNRIPRGWNLPVVYNRIVKKKVGWAPEASNEDPNESVTVFFACARIRLVYRTYNIKDVMKSIIDTYNWDRAGTFSRSCRNLVPVPVPDTFVFPFLQGGTLFLFLGTGTAFLYIYNYYCSILHLVNRMFRSTESRALCMANSFSPETKVRDRHIMRWKRRVLLCF